MSSVLKNVDCDQLRTHIIGFKYSWEYFCPTHTIVNPLLHLYRTCGQVRLFVLKKTFTNF